MATQTARLQLRKPSGADQVNVASDIGDNMQKLDDAVVIRDGTSKITVSNVAPNNPAVNDLWVDTTQ